MVSQSLLVVISSAPYCGDTAWNALRLANTAMDHGAAVRIFLINAGVDTGRKGARPPESQFDLAEMLGKLAEAGAEVKYCKTCIDRCGIGSGEMIEGISAGSMEILYNWIMESGKAVTF